MKKYLLVVLLPFLLMIGCSSEEEKTTPETSTEKTEIFKAQTDALKKAEKVEGLLLDNAAQKREAIEK